MPQKPQMRTEKLAITLLILVGFVAGYIYYSNFVVIRTGTPVPTIPRDLERFKTLGIDFGLLDRIGLEKLRIFGEQPVRPGAEGKIDLFAPF